MLAATPLRNPFSIASTPLDPTRSDSTAHRPAKDAEAFKALLPPEIEFVQGSSTGVLAVPEGTYKPINPTPSQLPSSPVSVSAEQSTTTTSSPIKLPPPQRLKASPGTSLPNGIATTPVQEGKQKSSLRSLHPADIDMTWPPGIDVGVGLFNTGNSCFLNSVLQCLLHTPPLIRLVAAHNPEECPTRGFCMTCSLRKTLASSHGKGNRRAFTPSEINNKLHAIAKHMRRGRQEDSHEFLRYAIDALQKSCLASHSLKPNAKLAETTWIHKIFAGRLRSRVTCEKCGHNSDTFDRALDLSLDISKANSLRDALRSFVAVDHLRGADKYKCEKCKQAVPARKQFTVHEAPLVLTIHLKRFSPLGRKIGNPIQYDEKITLKPVMSEGQHGPTYSLYGVICHAGGGPNSGHYLAFVKSRTGRWYEMNDDSVTLERGPPLNRKTAYILFYMQNPGQAGHPSVVHQSPAASTSTIAPSPSPSSSQALLNITKQNVIANMKKRKQMDGVQDESAIHSPKKAKNALFIGPTLPPSLVEAQRKLSLSDPQADKLKRKIAGLQPQTQLKPQNSLVDYASDDDAPSEEDVGVSLHKPTVSGHDSMMSSASSPAKGSNITSQPTSPSIPPTSSPYRASSPASPKSLRREKPAFYKPLPRPKKIRVGQPDADSSPPQDMPKSLSFSSFHPQNGSTPKKMHKHRQRDGDSSGSPRKARSSFNHGHHNPYSSHVTGKSYGKTYGRKRGRANGPP